jgi:hypothetical protein
LQKPRLNILLWRILHDFEEDALSVRPNHHISVLPRFAAYKTPKLEENIKKKAKTAKTVTT